MYLISKQFGDVAITFYKGFFLGVLFILLPFIKKRLQKFLIFACIVYILLTLSHLIRFFFLFLSPAFIFHWYRGLDHGMPRELFSETQPSLNDLSWLSGYWTGEGSG